MRAITEVFRILSEAERFGPSFDLFFEATRPRPAVATLLRRFWLRRAGCGAGSGRRRVEGLGDRRTRPRQSTVVVCSPSRQKMYPPTTLTPLSRMALSVSLMVVHVALYNAFSRRWFMTVHRRPAPTLYEKSVSLKSS
jgi:hypothetical protein